MNTREISLIAMMAAMLFVFTSIEMFVPVPVGMIGLYVFRRFGRDAVKALFISNILQVFFLVFAFFDAFIIFMWVCTVAKNWLISAIIIRDSFVFRGSTIFNIGGILSLPFAFFSVIFSFENAGTLIGDSLGYVPTTPLATGAGIMVAIVIFYFTSGIIMLIGFKIVKEILDRSIIKVEIFDKIIGGSIMYKKNDEKGGCLNVFRNV